MTESDQPNDDMIDSDEAYAISASGEDSSEASDLKEHYKYLETKIESDPDEDLTMTRISIPDNTLLAPELMYFLTGILAGH